MTRWSVPLTVRALLFAALALVAVQSLHAAGLFAGASTLIDHWLYGAIPILAAAAIAARALLVRSQRLAWSLSAAAVAVWAIGNVLWLTVFDSSPGSVADLLCALLYPLLYASLLLRSREVSACPPRSMWIDGLLGSLTVSAVAVQLVGPSATAGSGYTPTQIVFAMALPLADVVLLGVVFVVYGLAAWRPGRQWLLTGAAVLSLTLADWLYLWGDQTGHHQVADAARALWTAAMALIAVVAWLAPRPAAPPRAWSLSVIIAPSVSFAIAVGLVVVGDFVRIEPDAIALAAAAVIAAIARAAWTFRELRNLPEARRQASTDALTGLLNRRSFFGELQRRLERDPRRPLSVLMLDLDRFKELNDAMGHRAGDLLLEQLGPRLAASLRPEDVIGRLGGDEFAVLCPDTTSAEAGHVAQRLQSSLRDPFALDGMLIHAAASVGIASYPEHGSDMEGLVQRADVAMYQAKSDRTGSELYDAARDVHSRDRLALVADLRGALDRGDGIVLHFQPQVDLRTGNVEALEALVRWEHPERGLLGPGDFLAVADGAGLMRSLTSRVLELALEHLAAWQAEGSVLPVAINLAPGDLVDAGLPGELAALIERHGVDGGLLKLEITETAVIPNPERAVATLQQLRALGCRIALDDFGVGHSSLGLLKSLPADELKIDRSFVARIGEDARDAAIVRAAVGIARDTGMHVVAEGLETEDVWGRLLDYGCTSAQGFFISRPMPAAEVASWRERRQRGGEPAALS